MSQLQNPCPKKSVEMLNLIDAKTENLSVEFQKALEEIFTRFDVNGDGHLSTDELRNLSGTCNHGRAFSDKELEEIRTYFDCDVAKGGLTLKGFCDMYHTQSVADPEESWKDLVVLGYTENLKLKIPGKCCALGCDADATMMCPTCAKLGIPTSQFCSQECFKRSWKSHKQLHKFERKPFDEEAQAAHAAAEAEEEKRNAAIEARLEADAAAAKKNKKKKGGK